MQDVEDYLFNLSDEELVRMIEKSKEKVEDIDYPKPLPLFDDEPDQSPSPELVTKLLNESLAKPLAQELPTTIK